MLTNYVDSVRCVVQLIGLCVREFKNASLCLGLIEQVIEVVLFFKQ